MKKLWDKIDCYKELRNVVAHNDYENLSSKRINKLNRIGGVVIDKDVVKPLTDDQILKEAINTYNKFITKIIEKIAEKL